MATINTDLPLSHDTDLQPTSGKFPIVFDDLSFHVEVLSDDPLYTGNIIFIHLTETERNEAKTFYDTNKNLDFNFVNPHDGETYTLKFIDPPPKSRLETNQFNPRYTMTYSVIGII